MIDFSNPKKGTELELPELASSRELSGVRFVVEDIFQGGMGICLKLRHVGTNEPFALKIIKPEFLGDQTTWARFIEELKWWLTLSACEGVAEAHCIVRVNEIPCMCAAWLHHGNLRQFIGHGKPTFAFQTMIRIVRTLEWAYTKYSVIHRDLKPENILLDQDGRAFVSDWGLAKAINSFFEENRLHNTSAAAGSPQLTQAGHIVGTMLYAAPEQILGLSTIDHRADIYSLGCILFEWETGHPPFIGRDHMEVAQQHVQVPPPKLGGLFRKTNLGLEDVIAHCLEKDPGRRFQDYDSLAQAMMSVAKQKHFGIEDFHPAERYHRAKPGSDELQKQLAAIKRSPQGYGWIENEETLKHVDQAIAESALGNYAEAAKILAPFYNPEICRKVRIWTDYHINALNYGLYLSQSQLGQREAVSVFESLQDAEPKPPEFFVNFSLVLLRSGDFGKAEALARQGLVANPNDKDLVGNLTNALRMQGRLDDALEFSRIRLGFGRDIHALEEAGNILQEIGDNQGDKTKAVECYSAALAHLTEAKNINPRYIVVRVILAMVLRKLQRFGDAYDEVNAIRQFAENRSQYETGAVLMAELLADVKSYQKCIDFCNEWIPTLKISTNKTWMEKILARALAFQQGQQPR